MNTKETILCSSLEEVRENIDQIDDALISLIAQRNYYVNQAAYFKTSIENTVAQDRVNEVIQKVRSLAKMKGLNPTLTEKIYRTMIKEFTEQELAIVNPTYRDIKNSYY
ncbi:chorismate mutase [Dysgonomonas sp.]|jgi:isochorismate pyruvate lyase